MKNYLTRKGAIGALLDEYEKAIDELKELIGDITEKQLAVIVDEQTADEDCRSVQTILTHVVRAGFNYSVAIHRTKQPDLAYRDKKSRTSAHEYTRDLDEVFRYTEEVLGRFTDREIEEHDNGKKILSRWEQRYDIEQLMEHAIVHILRHRRQIHKFKIKLRGQAGV
jgi:uncharacterized damage-inducible protein DinB